MYNVHTHTYIYIHIYPIGSVSLELERLIQLIIHIFHVDKN